MDINSPLPSREIKIEPEIEEKITPGEEVPETMPAPGRTDMTSSQPVAKKPKGLPLASGMKFGVVGILLVAAIIGGIMIFRPKNKTTGGKQTTVNYWGLWEEEAVMNGLIAKFEEKNPGIKINYQKQNKENYRTRLEARLEKSEDAPDIFRFHSSWLPMIGNRLETVPKTVSQNLKLDEDFFDVYKKDLKDGNNYMGIPLMYDGLMMFYNKDLLDAANKTPPKTWWGLSQLAADLTVKDDNGDIKVAGVAMGTTGNVDNWQDIVGVMMMQNGVDLTKMDAGNLTKLRGVLDFYKYFGQKQKWNIWSDKLPSSTEAFAAGKVVFYFGQSWRILEINERNRNLNWAVAKIPQLPTVEGLDPQAVEDGLIDAKLTDINWATYWVEGVSNKSQNKEAAWKFLQFLASEEGLTDFFAAASQLRDFGEIYPRKSMASKLTDNKKLAAFTDSADTAVSGWPSSRTWDDGLNQELSKYLEAGIMATGWNEESEKALTDGIARVVNMYKLK